MCLSVFCSTLGSAEALFLSRTIFSLYRVLELTIWLIFHYRLFKGTSIKYRVCYIFSWIKTHLYCWRKTCCFLSWIIGFWIVTVLKPNQIIQILSWKYLLEIKLTWYHFSPLLLLDEEWWFSTFLTQRNPIGCRILAVIMTELVFKLYLWTETGSIDKLHLPKLILWFLKLYLVQ